MLLRRAVCVGLLAFSGLAVAQHDVGPRDQTPRAKKSIKAGGSEIQGRAPGGFANAGGAGVVPRRGQLIARKPIPKIPSAKLQIPDGASGRLVVKFVDGGKVSVRAGGLLVSKTNLDLSTVEDLLEQHGLTITPVFAKSQEVLAELETRAGGRSGFAQPYLAGLVYVNGPAGVPLAVAKALNELDIVEFSHYEPKYRVAGDNPGCDLAGGDCCIDNGPLSPGCDDSICCNIVCDIRPSCCTDTWDQQCADFAADFCGDVCGPPPPLTGACCLDNNDCLPDMEEQPCCDIGGIFVLDTPCVDAGGTDLDCNIECGNELAGDCYEIHCSVYCNLDACCNDVCAIDPFCCDVDVTWAGRGRPGWDPWCVEHVEQICGPDPNNPPNTPSVCGNPNVGTCFEVHPDPGCSSLLCCNAVCNENPECCDFTWTAACVQFAESLCILGKCTPPIGDCFVTTEPLCDAVLGDWVAGETCTVGVNTPNFTRAQGYLTPEAYTDPPPPEIVGALAYDADGILLDGFQGQGYDLQELWELGEIVRLGACCLPFDPMGLEDDCQIMSPEACAAIPPNIDGIAAVFLGPGVNCVTANCGHTASVTAPANLTRGRSIKVGIVEFSAFVETAIGNDAPYQHEDLHGKVIPEPGQTPIITPLYSGHHGTACLGIVGAIDHDADGLPIPPTGPNSLSPDESRADEVGCVGIAPEAELYFFPIVSFEEPGGRLLDAIASALTIFGPGDVLSFSIGPGFGTLASDPGPWLMLRLAADLGVTCCLAAGNDCFNLDGNPQAGDPTGNDPRGDCDAVIVGACFPGFGVFNQYCRLGFSNHCQACGPDSAVHISAWGTAVATLGYGSMYLQGLNRSYTNDFGGTSAAAPQVAGLIACLQGLAKQMFGIPITPAQMRNVVSGNGFLQCGFIDLADVPGNELTPCVGDWNQAEPANRIGVHLPTNAHVSYNSASVAGQAVIATSFFDQASRTVIEGIRILRGELLQGNVNSIRAPDNSYLVIEGVPTVPNSPPNVPSVTGVNPNYLFSGIMTDVEVEARLPLSIPGALTVEVESNDALDTAVLFVYLFNWDTNLWQFGGFGMVGPAGPGGVDTFFEFDVGSADPFVRGDGKIVLRVWTIALGISFGGGGGSQNIIRHDLIRFANGPGGATVGPGP